MFPASLPSDSLTVVINAITMILILFQGLLLIRLLMSWLAFHTDTKFYEIVYAMTEIILSPVRGLVKSSVFANPSYRVDLSPLVTIMLLGGFQYALQTMLV